jgi:hypothetical protein
MFVGEVYAKNGEGIITIGARGSILRRAEFGQNFLDDYTAMRRKPSMPQIVSRNKQSRAPLPVGPTVCIRLGQVRESFMNLRRPFGSFRRARDCSDYGLERMKGAAIADPETGNLLTAMHSGRSANCSTQKI